MEWKNFDQLESYKKLDSISPVDLKTAMAGENGAKRVEEYRVPLAGGMVYSFAAKAVDD